jgi:hypothetical protein
MGGELGHRTLARRAATVAAALAMTGLAGCGNSSTVGSARGCDPNYTGACLDPSASDYDCASGSGNGPEYTGPVHVVANDHFGIDRDGDGDACESS